MKERTVRVIAILAVLVALGVSITWGLCTFERNFTEGFTILQSKRPITDAEWKLTEVEALEIARTSLDAAGYSSQQWLPWQDDRSEAPEKYFLRNTNDGFSGSIMFMNNDRHDGYAILYVRFERDGSKLIVRVSRGH